MMMTRRDAVAAFALFADLIASGRDVRRANPDRGRAAGRRSSCTICRTSRWMAGR